MNESKIDPDSREWRIVTAWAGRELEIARAGLESPACDERRGHALRGRIATIRELLALTDQPRQEATEAADPFFGI